MNSIIDGIVMLFTWLTSTLLGGLALLLLGWLMIRWAIKNKMELYQLRIWGGGIGLMLVGICVIFHYFFY